jgi:phosphatidylglycerol---prolipoprotein diacylglyceryl transferase
MSPFLTFWQHIPEKIDPVLIGIGPFQIHYYGLMYLLAFGITYALVIYRTGRENRFKLNHEAVQNILTAMIIGLVLGGRIGYVLFYNFGYYAHHPLEIFLPFDFSNGITFTGISGMSYHGGLIGVLAATLWYARKSESDFWDIADLFAPAVPLGYTFGRIGNFINGELYGRVTTWPLGMYFPLANDGRLRHPSQLYEAIFEGIFIFCILWAIRQKVRVKGAMLPLYLICYGTVRFFIEYFREPDAQIGFVLLGFSMGQLLCAAMIGLGCGLLFYRIRRDRVN